MSDESNENAIPQKPKRQYIRKQSAQIQQQPIPPNPHVAALEADLVPLVNQRLEANRKLLIASQKAQHAAFERDNAQSELQQIEGEINYRLQLIAQLKNGGMPVPQAPYIAQNLQPGGYGAPQAYSPPYTPAIPYPTMPQTMPGLGSMPAQNRGLYPDATDREESAEDIRMLELGRRGF